MEFDDRPFWKPRDLAALLAVSPSHIYRLIETGQLEHRKIGERTVRVPAAAAAELAGEAVPRTTPVATEAHVDLRDRHDRFVERTGYSPNAFVEAWRGGDIPDTPESSGDAMEALALREIMMGAVAAAGT